jgi:3-phenylpropionate/cinnamic acid dioxygenase small subunit
MKKDNRFVVENYDLAIFFQQFLFQEARLLDEQKFDEWSELFVEDGEYWVPVSPNQPDPRNYISLMYETDLLRAVRIRRYSHPNAFSLQPRPRSSHIVSNVLLDSENDSENEYVVHSKFVMSHYRNLVQDIYTGTYTHDLRLEGGKCKIVRKKVDLVNCDAALGNIMLYF